MKFVRLLNDYGNTYDSYVDLFSLIRLSGFDTIEQNEVNADVSDAMIFPMNNGNAQAMVAGPRKFRAILWQLERPANGFHELVPPCWDEVWISDRWLAGECQQHHPKVKYVTLGGHPGLGGEPLAEKKYDFAVMAYLHGAREAKVNRLKQQGYTMAPNGWGEERAAALAASRRGLCLHQPPVSPIIEPLRMTLFSVWRLPLVCDPSMDTYPYKTYGLQDIDRADDWQSNYELLTGAMNFRACVEGAL